MTIIIYFHMSCICDFKTYYTQYVMKYLHSEFPDLIGNICFVELMPEILLPLYLYLHTRHSLITGISFVDATSFPICHNQCIEHHKVFVDLAARGKTSKGLFFGLILHLVVYEQGNLLTLYPTASNVDDCDPVPKLSQRLFRKLFGAKGYISQSLIDQLIV